MGRRIASRASTTLLLLTVTFAYVILQALPVQAQTLVPRFYGKDDGIADSELRFVQETLDGRLLIGTASGFALWDGQWASEFEPQYAKAEFGAGITALMLPDGRILAVYEKRVVVYAPYEPRGSVSAPRYRALWRSPGLIGDRSQVATLWGTGAVLCGERQCRYVDLRPGHYGIEASSPLSGHAGVPRDISAVHDAGQTLWVGGGEDVLCGLNARQSRRGAARCFGTESGLLPEWIWAITSTPDGRIFVRTSHDVEGIDPAHGRVSVHPLPQMGRASAPENFLRIAPHPDFGLLTQASDGIVALQPNGSWTLSRLSADSATVSLSDFTVDRDDNLWIGTLGDGLVRAIGYGIFENFTHANGLSRNTVWQSIDVMDGKRLVATDGGIDILDPASHTIRPFHDFATYTLTSAPDGSVWSADGPSTIVNFDLRTEAATHYPAHHVNQILSDRSGAIWCLTDSGVFTLNKMVDHALQPVAGLTDPSPGGTVATDGTVWVIVGGKLYFRAPGKKLQLLDVSWPDASFRPETLSSGSANELWVGGTGEAYRVRRNGSTAIEVTSFGGALLKARTVYSIFCDSRHWVWIGTERGLFVFDGRRWAQGNTTDGLASDNIDEDSISESPDGTIWLGTANGLSHLVRPASLFAQRKLRPFISEIRAGGRVFEGETLSYKNVALDVRFGALDLRDQDDIRFRYRLSGVDPAWVESSQRGAHYPTAPPGSHCFELIAFNVRTHVESAPISVVFQMGYPALRTWPAYGLYGMALVVLCHGLRRWRDDAGMERTRALERLVHEQTELLAIQARTDSLTGLLNRRAIQETLIGITQSKRDTRALFVALIDLDHFKAINDVHGHLAGDDVLVEFARRAQCALRGGEYVGRYGGEEFLAIFRATSSDIEERLLSFRTAIQMNPFIIVDTPLHLTFSAGVTNVSEHEPWMSAISRADRALYQAKYAGRERTYFVS